MVDPASVRPRLAEAAAESLEDIRRVLVETATGANKQLWATITCKHCDRAGRYEITVPDNKVRLDAVQALLHEALGRPGQAEAQAAPALPRTVEQVRALSWDQMNLIFASQFADEIALRDRGGDGFLRQRLAALVPTCAASCARRSPSPSSSDQSDRRRGVVFAEKELECAGWADGECAGRGGRRCTAGCACGESGEVGAVAVARDRPRARNQLGGDRGDRCQ